jgi:hypothetical protein
VISGLSVARGHIEIINVSKTPVLHLHGNLNDRGIIYLVSTNPLVASVSVKAENVFIGAGARITTALPSGGLMGYSNAINNLSLTIVASHNIVDNGAITSAGNLTARAGGTFSNQAVVSTSGAEVGGDADDITIIANEIDVDKPLLAVGSNGAKGPDATLPGQSGAEGQKAETAEELRLRLPAPMVKVSPSTPISKPMAAMAATAATAPKPMWESAGPAGTVAPAACPEPSALRPRALPSRRLRMS